MKMMLYTTLIARDKKIDLEDLYRSLRYGPTPLPMSAFLRVSKASLISSGTTFGRQSPSRS